MLETSRPSVCRGAQICLPGADTNKRGAEVYLVTAPAVLRDADPPRTPSVAACGCRVLVRIICSTGLGSSIIRSEARSCCTEARMASVRHDSAVVVT